MVVWDWVFPAIAGGGRDGSPYERRCGLEWSLVVCDVDRVFLRHTVCCCYVAAVADGWWWLPMG
ncbi:hypothetical protein HanIR_Chr08g0354991 [Helianthus annuus]|nr:hypothetical protein HanIR_Chr08g0354991 [Helianthus annuus]